MQTSATPKRKLAWMTGVTVVLGAGLATAWQTGWLPMPKQDGMKDNEASPRMESSTAAAVSPPVPASPAPAQLKLGEWVCAHGGSVNVQMPTSVERPMGGNADIHHVNALPAGPFAIWRVNFSSTPIASVAELEELVSHIREAGSVANLNLRGIDLPVEALKSLATIETLTNLDLMASAIVTHDAIPYLVACKHLNLLRIGGSQLPVDSSIAEELRLLMPNCAVVDTD